MNRNAVPITPAALKKKQKEHRTQQREQAARVAAAAGAKHREAATGLTPLVAPAAGLWHVVYSVAAVTALYAAALFVVAAGAGLLACAPSLSPAVTAAVDLAAAASPLSALPAPPAFRRLMLLSFQDNPPFSSLSSSPSSSSSASLRNGSLQLPFADMLAVKASVAANGILLPVTSTPAAPPHIPRDFAISAVSGIHSRLPESLSRLFFPALTQDSFPTQFTRFHRNRPTDADSPEDATAICYGDGGWDAHFPTTFYECQAGNLVSRIDSHLRTTNFGFIAAHLSVRDLHQTGGIDGFLQITLPLVDKDTLVVVLHSAHNKANVLFHSDAFSTAEPQLELESILKQSSPRSIDIEDLASTLAVLFGTDIPFTSEGTVIPDVIWHSTPGSTEERTAAVAAALRRNLQQLEALAGYVLSEDDKQDHATTLTAAQNAVRSARAELSADPVAPNLKLAKSLAALVQKPHIVFDRTTILLGIIIIVSVLALSLAHTFEFFDKEVVLPDETILMAGSFGGLIGLFDGLEFAINTLVPTANIDIDRNAQAVFTGSMALIISYVIYKLYRMTKPAKQLYTPLSNAPSIEFNFFSVHGLVAVSTVSLLVLSPIAMHLIGLSERDAVLYGIQTFTLAYFVAAFYLKNEEHRDSVVKFIIFFFALTRIGLIFDSTTSPFFASQNEQLNSALLPSLVSLLNFLLATAMCFALFRLLNSTGNIYATASVIGGVFVPLGLYISAIFWFLDTLHVYPVVMLQFGDAIKFVQYWANKLGFVALSLSSLYLWYSDPNCVGYDAVDSDTLKKEGSDATAQANSKSKGKTYFFMGISNGVGTSYFCLFIAVYMALNFTQMSIGSAVLSIGILQVFCLIELNHLWRDKIPLDAIAEPGATTPITFSLLAVELPSDGSLGYGGIKPAVATKPNSGVYLLIMNYLRVAILILRSFTPQIVFGGLATLLVVTWKRSPLKGKEIRTLRELVFATSIKFGVLSGALLAADVAALWFAKEYQLDTIIQVVVVRGIGVLVEGLAGVVGVVGVLLAMLGYMRFFRRIKKLGALDA
eukprot:jgi/Hompol1/6100/HPOL_000360-RA